MMAIGISVIQPTFMVVKSLSLETNDAYQATPGRRAIPDLTLSAEVAEGTIEGGTTVYRCTMTIVLAKPPDDKPLPYTVKMVVVGGFAFFEQAGPPKNVQWMHVANNGLAMLYGFARDALLSATGTAAHGSFILPAINIGDLAKDLLERVPGAELVGVPVVTQPPASASGLPSKPKRSRKKIGT